MYKKIKQFSWIVLILIILIIIGYLYSAFFKPNYGGTNIMGVLLLGLALGGVIAFLAFQLYSTNRREQKIIESSHTVVESMRKVFKIVCAEGQFHEIYNYEETKKILKIIPSTKKALVIVQAKVMIGYDFEKCVWEKDEQNRKIKIISFPEPEILSVEPEYKYYHFEEDIFNLIIEKLADDIKTVLAKDRQTVINNILHNVADIVQEKFIEKFKGTKHESKIADYVSNVCYNKDFTVSIVLGRVEELAK